MRRHPDTHTLDLFALGEAGRDEGMTRAVEHADAVIPGWSDRAMEMLDEYLSQQPGRFIAPDVRAWAHDRGLPTPPTALSWGSVIRTAAERGKIKRVGYQQYGNATMHTQSVSVWQRP
jgi:hypothetical protein